MGAIAVLTVMLFLASPLTLIAAGDEGPRQQEAQLPTWEVDDSWSYYMNDDELSSYPIVLVMMQDEFGKPYQALLCNYPQSREYFQEYTMTSRSGGEYYMSLAEDVFETGTWRFRKVVANQPRCDNGDVVASGTYNKTENNTGLQKMVVDNLNSNGDELTIDSMTKYDGDYYFIITVDGTHENTVDKACQQWKPDWSTSPMKKDDSWKMDCTETDDYSEFWEAQGNLQGEFWDNGTYTFVYDINYTVVQVTARVVEENNYPEAYKARGVGTLEWDWEDEDSNTANGNENIVTEKWYADEGDYWDAGWGIEYDGIKYLSWSTHGPDIDWNNPPSVAKAPPSEIDIEEEEEWTFWDYDVEDADPGACGDAGFMYSIKALYDGEEVLENLTIDRDGFVSLTPNQQDVAPGYEVTITVSDSCPDSALSVDIPFTLNILNVNDAPTANPNIMYDFYLEENNHTVSEWSIYDVFHDEDMEISAVTGLQYDPAESLRYIVESNGSVWVEIDEVTGNVTFTAPDNMFPVDQNISLAITAQDSKKAKASAGLMIRVLHRNHAPYTLDGDDEVTMEEDEVISLDFEDYFADFDVDNPAYLANDDLYYFAWAKTNITVEREGHLFKLMPWKNWNGKETINLRATDTWGGRAETTIELTVTPVNDPPTVYFQTPDEEYADLDEPHDGLPGQGFPRAIVLSVTAHDIDDSNIWFNWTVQDVDTGEILDWDLGHSTMKSFNTATKGEFSDGKFNGGEDAKEYIVECTVSDGEEDLRGGRWFITVHNVNRPPRLSSVLVSRNKNTILTPVDETDFRNYTLGYGKLYEFSTFSYLSDGDSELDELDCEWSTDKGQVLAFGRCDEFGAINISTGVKKSKAVAKLKPGTHLITIKVTDEMDDSATVTFTVKVEGEPPSALESIDLEGIWLYIVVFVIFFVIMMAVGFVLASRTGRAVPPKAPSRLDDRTYLPPGQRVEEAVILPEPQPPPRPPRPPKGMVKKKKKKTVKKLKGIKASAPKVRKKTKKKKRPKKEKWVEDIPEDWR
jgi:hypothetical protein